MKYTKKLLSLVLVLVLALALAVPGFAAEITISGALEGETYKAYKIFDYTKSGENVSYTMETSSKWASVVSDYTYNDKKIFTLTESQNPANTYFVKVDSVFTDEATKDAAAADFADYLSKHIPSGALYSETTGAAASGETKFTNLDVGYYFVDTTTGSLCSLVNIDTSQTLEEKNVAPTLTKTVNITTATIDDDVITYTITVTDGKGTDEPITIHDKMEAGLTKTADFTVEKVVGDARTTLTKDVDYTVPAELEDSDCSFEIVLSKDLVTSLNQGDKVVVTYSAKLNAQAEIYNNTNDNTAWMTYSQQESTPVTVSVTAYKFDVVKTDGANKILNGAGFKLYDAKTGGNEIEVIQTGEGQYRVALESEQGVEIMPVNGQATISGLKGNNTYYLEETTTPAGYNPLAERKAVTIESANLEATVSDSSWIAGGVHVVNETGTLLPSTGGMGTTIFYTLGGVLVVGAAILLVTKKRVHDVEG